MTTVNIRQILAGIMEVVHIADEGAVIRSNLSQWREIHNHDGADDLDSNYETRVRGNGEDMLEQVVDAMDEASETTRLQAV